MNGTVATTLVRAGTFAVLGADGGVNGRRGTSTEGLFHRDARHHGVAGRRAEHPGGRGGQGAEAAPVRAALDGERLGPRLPGGRQFQHHLVDVEETAQVGPDPLREGAGALPVRLLAAVGDVGGGVGAVRPAGRHGFTEGEVGAPAGRGGGARQEPDGHQGGCHRADDEPPSELLPSHAVLGSVRLRDREDTSTRAGRAMRTAPGGRRRRVRAAGTPTGRSGTPTGEEAGRLPGTRAHCTDFLSDPVNILRCRGHRFLAARAFVNGPHNDARSGRGCCHTSE